jgi:pimeloyl-ACP methyl ester carboxylesterase
MTTIAVRDARLFVDVVGRGYPLVLMHGGPGADHWTLLPFRQLADRFTLIFYDHRCNGRSVGAPVSSMTWENLTADADTLRESLGFDKWAVLGHSFGGKVALEYALRYPNSLSHLILLDTGGDSWWEQENAPRLLAKRGFSAEKVELARRWFTGRTAPWEFFPTLMRLGGAYDPHTSWYAAVRTMFAERHTKPRPQAQTFGFSQLMKGWTVMDRLDQIRVPTLVIAGRDDFLFPPEHQSQLAAGIPNARLEIIERAGHNPHNERPADVMKAVTDFIPADAAGRAEDAPAVTASVTKIPDDRAGRSHDRTP